MLLRPAIERNQRLAQRSPERTQMIFDMRRHREMVPSSRPVRFARVRGMLWVSIFCETPYSSQQVIIAYRPVDQHRHDEQRPLARYQFQCGS